MMCLMKLTPGGLTAQILTLFVSNKFIYKLRHFIFHVQVSVGEQMDIWFETVREATAIPRHFNRRPRIVDQLTDGHNF